MASVSTRREVLGRKFALRKSHCIGFSTAGSRPVAGEMAHATYLYSDNGAA
jgi:hypothetical protein